MNRRELLTKATAALPMLPILLASLATQAQATSPVDSGTFTDIDSDYAHWDTKNNGLTRSKVLMIENSPGSEGLCRLIRFSPGFKVPRHFHPMGELTYVLAGEFGQVVIDPVLKTSDYVFYTKGDVIWMPANSVHEESETLNKGTTILSFTPKNIQFSGF